MGIDNTRKRLELVSQGQLYIESTIGEGTTCRVVIPKNFNLPKVEAKK